VPALYCIRHSEYTVLQTQKKMKLLI